MKRGDNLSRQFAEATEEIGPVAGYVVPTSRYADGARHRQENAAAPEPEQGGDCIPRPCRQSRYSDQPTGWRTRLVGFSGTASIFGLVLAASLVTWQAVRPTIAVTSQPLTVVDLAPLAAPPEPVKHVAPGPEQIEKQEATPELRQTLPAPIIQLPATSSVKVDLQTPTEIVDPGTPAPETTAPKSIAAPIASRLANEAKPDWEGLILAHLERFRRYPPRARAGRRQGTAYIRFTMNRAGLVLSSEILKKSGSFDLDQAALDTLRRAQPLPAIPADRPDVVELTIPVEFSLR